MTPALRVTLRAEGPSDDMLLPIIRWTLRRHLGDYPIDVRMAGWAGVPSKPTTLSDQVFSSVQLFPCDVLFIHLDADRYGLASRRDTIHQAISELAERDFNIPHVCVIPVRESESWALFDENAIRAAAANRRGTVSLPVPAIRTIERNSDPKTTLDTLIRTASEQTGRGLEKLMHRFRPRDVIDWIDDFTPLLKLSAFRAFDADVKGFADSWNAPAD